MYTCMYIGFVPEINLFVFDGPEADLWLFLCTLLSGVTCLLSERNHEPAVRRVSSEGALLES